MLDRRWVLGEVYHISSPQSLSALMSDCIISFEQVLFGDGVRRKFINNSAAMARFQFWTNHGSLLLQGSSNIFILPSTSPVPLARWTWADSQPDSIYDEAVHNKTVFMSWFNKRILPADHDYLICSSGFLLHIDSSGGFSSRNQYLSPPGLPFGFSNAGISIFSEAPDTVFPLGQIPIFSSITNQTEFLPVTIDVIAARGCDGLIARLAKDLVAAGVLNAPSTGSGLDSGTILLRRDYRY